MKWSIAEWCTISQGVKQQKSAADPIEVDLDDILADINVLEISVTSAKANHAWDEVFLADDEMDNIETEL